MFINKDIVEILEILSFIPTLLTATSVFIIAFIAAPPVDIDGCVCLLFIKNRIV